MKICVQGLWHLGTVTAACLASKGHGVTGLDFDAQVVAGLQSGRPPLFEPGLEDLLKQGLTAGTLRFTADPHDALSDAELLWVTYDTPVDDDDNADVDFVVAQVERALPFLASGAIVLISSQMPVGSVARLEQIAAHRCPGKNLRFASSPENLRLGKALAAFLEADRIVVGVRTPRDRAQLEAALSGLCGNIQWMRVESAEMTKHAINAFLAVSVTFANEIAAICEGVGADAKEVERGLKSEPRIGPKAYLSPGGAFAGGTLARDIAFLGKAAAAQPLTIPLLGSVKASNDAHKHWSRRKLQTLLPAFPHVTVAVWGLTYKPNTDTLRRSMAVELVDWMLKHGVTVRIHDPAVPHVPDHWKDRVTRCDAPLDALAGAQALVIGTEWALYKDIPPTQIAAAAPGLAVLDANRFLAPLATQEHVRHVAVGTPEAG